MGEKTIWPGSTQLAPVPVVLVGCGDGTSFKYNLITVAWTGIVCSEPPLVAVAVRPERYSYGLLISTGEFTVNMPSCRLAAAVDFCGVRSGRDLDKFKACQLTPRRGSRVAAPLVDAGRDRHGGCGGFCHHLPADPARYNDGARER